MNYYNEFDPKAAAWLQQLISQNIIPNGHVDTRSITDVTASDLAGYTQCHFFAGIGGWSRALFLAGVPSTTPLWTGSCPCQPFSNAGKRRGTEDERHLWPIFRALIAQCNPPIVFGEQVASKDGRAWLEDVRFDLQTIRYWRHYYKNLHSVRESAADGELSEILREIIRRVEAALPILPERIREGVEEIQQRPTEINPTPEEKQGSCIQARVRPPEQGQDVNYRSGEKEQAKEHPVQSFGVHTSDRGKDPKRTLRNDGHPVQLSLNWPTDMEQSVSRPNRSEERLCLGKYPSDPFLHELSNGELGRGSDEGSSRNLDGKESLNDERTATEAFRVLIKESIERSRLASVRSDLEALDYAVGAADLCAAGVGAPHIRQRLWFVGMANPNLFDDDGRGSCSGDDSRKLPKSPDIQRSDDGVLRSCETHSFWQDADWLLCRDERWRPVEPIHVKMVDGVSSGMGRSGDHLISEEDRRTRMQVLLDAFGEEEIQRQAGRQWSVQEEGLLQQIMHGGMDGGADKGGVREEQSQAVSKSSERILRDMQPLGHKVVGASQGCGPDEQQPVELADIVRLLPSSLSLSKLHGRRRDAEVLHVLLRAIREIRGVQHASGSMEEAWASLGKDEKERVAMGFDAGAWRRVVPFPLANGIPARVGRLRGYGNAIVPQVAATFIRAALM